ncbi:baseplate megatron protein TIM-barrel domain-containing protein [Boseongicola aestuarii]|uniref:baseplate megatron protein TIM-barrel domain-containing protein n=1 Tax=Boseongicola aestuarii TaxID=1470561 RepID=UPI001595F166|nr:glycoside hydrolase TIM-barrel-like domain-containing protein [Boseongicola aestuarii]
MDEIGCAALDKATNQPNKFLDAKSSESALPKYSNGARDDLIQMQYLRAMAEFWRDPANNPEATLYDGQMVDPDRMFVWAWDTRPFPHFPGNAALWSDGKNYGRGHWLSGRVSSRSLAGVVAEVCAKAGVSDVDVSELYGFVRGYRLNGDEDARSALQPLLLASGVDAVERDGRLVFKNRDAHPVSVVTPDHLVREGDAGQVVQTREPVVDVPGRVRLNFIEADGSYQLRAEESIYPDGTADGVASSEVALVLTQSEGAQTTERWLSEVRVARDKVTLMVPPSFAVAAGDVVQLETGEVSGQFRVDRIEDAGAKVIEAVRVVSGAYEAAPTPDVVVPTPTVTAPMPVWPMMLDLPLLAGNESPETPVIAVAASPWPGSVAVYGSDTGDDWGFEANVPRAAIIGETLSPLSAARVGQYDRGAALEVKLSGGALGSIGEAALLNGGNLAAIGDPLTGAWEVFQFRDAILVGADTWALSMRLRGQRGTDGLVPGVWPVGSVVVILDGNIVPIPLSPNRRGAARSYRVGPASKPVDHPAYRTLDHTAMGIGLRPFTPVHLGWRRDGLGDVTVSWTRQSRIDGDFWEPGETPLGEAREAYRVRVRVGGVVRREVTVVTPSWVYSAVDQLSDSISGAFVVEVAQISDRFGPGLFGKVSVDD